MSSSTDPSAAAALLPAGPAGLDGGDPQQVAWSVHKRRRLARGRWLSGVGGLLLACSFFLPAVPVCNAPFVPAVEAWEALRSTPPEWDGVFSVLWIPYLFGLLVLVIALRGRSSRRRTQRWLGISVAVLFAPVAVYLAAGLVMELCAGNTNWNPLAMVLYTVLVASPLYFLRSVRMGPGGLLCLRWYAAGCCGLWFTGHVIYGKALYGLWLSLAGAWSIFAAAWAEAAVRAGSSTRATLWKLLRGRLELYDLDEQRCQGCGYLLVGLTEPRCPECGRPSVPAPTPAGDRG